MKGMSSRVFKIVIGVIIFLAFVVVASAMFGLSIESIGVQFSNIFGKLATIIVGFG